MDVKLEPFVGKSVASGREVRFDQYRIRVDGKHAGLIGTHEGARALMSTRFTPLEMKEIESQIEGILESGEIVSRQAPDVPDEVLNAKPEDDLVDDLDA